VPFRFSSFTPATLRSMAASRRARQSGIACFDVVRKNLYRRRKRLLAAKHRGRHRRNVGREHCNGIIVWQEVFAGGAAPGRILDGERR
jgi:hypothetical protein